MQYFFKILVTSILVVAISELGKKFSLIASILASLPILSILAMVWIYIDEKNVGKVINLSYGVFWMVIPSLLFFLVLPGLLKTGMRFYYALPLASLIMFGAYSAYVFLLAKVGVKI